MIPPEMVELLQTGVSVVVGTRDAGLMPECTRAWGVVIGKDRASATIFLTETISRKTIENLKENGRIAISCTRPTDHMACQLKGQLRSIRPATKQDLAKSRAWHKEFTEELIAVGIPSGMCEALITEPALAVDLEVTEVFLQTPGPGTGGKV